MYSPQRQSLYYLYEKNDILTVGNSLNIKMEAQFVWKVILKTINDYEDEV